MSDRSARILLVENDLAIGCPICQALRELSLEPTWIVSVYKDGLNQEGFRGECVKDGQAPLQLQRFRGRWSDYSVALLDGVLGIDATDECGPHGWHIVPLLLIPCIAISSNASSNESMVQLGAAFQSVLKNKPILFKQEIARFLRQLQIIP